jgi:hypothetical protein
MAIEDDDKHDKHGTAKWLSSRYKPKRNKHTRVAITQHLFFQSSVIGLKALNNRGKKREKN